MSHVKDIVTNLATILKDSGDPFEILFGANKDDKTIEFNSVYAESVLMKRRISYHSDVGVFPEEIFENVAPNATDSEIQYIRDSYEQFTMATWAKGTGVVNRAFNEQNFSLTFNPDEKKFSDQTAQDYFRKEYPESKDIIKFWEQEYAPFKNKDPNALAVVDPFPISDDDTILDRPKIEIFGSNRVIAFDKIHAIVLLDEFSIVEFAAKKVSKGLIFLLYDENSIWKIVQTGKKIEFTFTFTEILNHDLGVLPVRKLKGEPISSTQEKIYKSYFFNAVPLLNVALYDSSILQASKAGHAFMEPWEMAERCDYRDDDGHACDDGRIFVDGSKHDCPHCKGSGIILGGGALKTKIIRLPDNLSTDVQLKPPFKGYVEKPFDILKFLREEIINNSEQAFANLNIDVASRPNGQTATEVKIDRDELFSFVLKISNELYADLDFFLEILGKLRYGKDDYQGHKLNPPNDFNIRSVNELTKELEQDMPAVAKREINIEILNQRFNADPETVNVEILKQNADRLYDLSELSVSQGRVTGDVAQWERILHDSFYFIVETLIVQDKNFVEKEFKDQKAALETEAKRLAAEINVSKPGSTEDLLNAAIE